MIDLIHLLDIRRAVHQANSIGGGAAAHDGYDALHMQAFDEEMVRNSLFVE